MVVHYREDIGLDKLLFDVNNPRHDVLEKQDETLIELLLDQKEKLVKLAQDITDNGIDPSALSIVIPNGDDHNSFIVLEGNRRLAALKLLGNPALAAMLSKKEKDLLKACHSRYILSPITLISCVVFPRREDANHWIELRHTGENEGKGIVSWRAKEKARFNVLNGKPSPSLQVVDFVLKNSELTEDEKASLEKPNISSIARLINDPDVRNKLGIDINDGYVTTNFPSKEIINGLTNLVVDIAMKKISVNDIRKKEDRRVYISKFPKQNLPNVDVKQIDQWNIQSQDNSVTPRFPLARRSASKGKRDVRLSISRTTLIPSKCVLKINSTNRIKKIYKELRGLEVQGYENACAITFRVFLELSVDEYAKSNNITFHENTYLIEKIKKVAKHIKSKGLITPDEMKPINVACSTKDSLLSTHTLNAYVHNPHINPRADDLKMTWDDFQKFFEAIWP